jgi:hypothetical protein
MAEWKTVKVIVEMPVIGKYSERDFAEDVNNCLRKGLRISGKASDFGQFGVKSFNMAQKKPRKAQFRTLRAVG